MSPSNHIEGSKRTPRAPRPYTFRPFDKLRAPQAQGPPLPPPKYIELVEMYPEITPAVTLSPIPRPFNKLRDLPRHGARHGRRFRVHL